MAISRSDVTAVVLCGGKSSRMGKDKARLDYKGESFLSHACESLSFCKDILLASGDKDYHAERVTAISDIYKDKGPLSGIYSAMKYSTTDYIFVLSVDLPLFTSSFGIKLLNEMTSSLEALVPITSDGRIHPLCAIYRCSVQDKALGLLEADNLKVINLLKEINTKYLDVGNCSELKNINTMDDYKRLVL